MKFKYFFVFGLLLNCFYCNDVNKFSAGSYPYAEIYLINKPEVIIINKINNIKKENPKLKVPKFEWAGSEVLMEDKNLKNGYFIFHIFIKDKNQIIKGYVKEEETNKTKIGIISIQNGLSLGNWKEVNKDLSTEENDQIKKEFEKEIINKLNNISR